MPPGAFCEGVSVTGLAYNFLLMVFSPDPGGEAGSGYAGEQPECERAASALLRAVNGLRRASRALAPMPR